LSVLPQPYPCHLALLPGESPETSLAIPFWPQTTTHQVLQTYLLTSLEFNVLFLLAPLSQDFKPLPVLT
jgi:hypothetical protein